MAIQGFGDPTTEDIYHGVKNARTRRLAALAPAALNKLYLLHAATDLAQLRFPPGNRLEALKGDLAGLHSIRINDQWRIVFRWTDTGPAEVRIVDYH